MSNVSLNIALNPVIDVNKLNAILASLKQAFKDFKPIDNAKLSKSLEGLVPDFAGLIKEANPFTDSVKGLGKEIDKTKEKAQGLGGAFNFNNMLGAVQHITSAFNQIAQSGISYESNLAAVGSITGFAGKELDVLGESARRLAKDFGGSATDQLLSFQGVLSKLGPEVAQDASALELLGKNINTLSAASGDDAATSMQAITDAMLQMGLATGTPMEIATKSTDVINALAASAKVGAAEIPEVAQSLVVAGVAAKGANIDLVDVNAAIQVLAVGGKRGAEAGTALRNVIGYLQKASGPAAEAMGRIGTSSAELGELLTTQGLDVALGRINEGLNNLGSDAEKNATLMQIFGMENAAAAGILLQNSDKFQEFSDGIKEGMEGQGDAFIQAAQRMDTAEGIISRVRANINDAFISLSQFAGQGVTSLVGITTEFAPMIATFAGLKDLIPEGAITAVKDYSATIISKLIPGLISQDAVTKSLAFNKEALNLANLKERASSAYDKVADVIKNAQLQLQTRLTHSLSQAKYQYVFFSGQAVKATIKESVADAWHSAGIWRKTTMQNASNAAKSKWNNLSIKSTLISAKELALSGLHVVLTFAKTAALSPLIAAQLAYNAALSANPMVLVGIAAVGLVGALVLLYKNVEGVREVFDGAWKVISTGASAVWDILKSIGSVIFEVGKLIFTMWVTPYIVLWNVLKTVGKAIGDAIASFMGVQNVGTVIDGIVTAITLFKDGVVSTFTTVKNFISSIIDGVMAFAEGVGQGIGKLMSLDFSGAIDSFAGIGGKTAKAFSDTFNSKMREQKFDEAKNALEKGFETAGKIEVKVKTKTDFKATVEEYEKIQSKISELSSKKSSGKASTADLKELDNLQAKSQKISSDIAKIAPNAVNGIRDIKVVNGEVIKSYDLNIAKAKEFGNASNFKTPLEEQKEAISKNLTEMANQYGQQKNAIKGIQGELKKVGKDGEGFDKLEGQLKDATAQSDEMKDSLVKGLIEAGEKGMLTDDAIRSVAKSLGMTEEETRKMLLADALKKASDSGLITDSIIAGLAKQYGVTQEEAKKLAAKSKEQTKNVEETEQKVLSLADAWKQVGEAINSAFDKSKGERSIVKMAYELSHSNNEKDREQFKRFLQKSNEETRKLMEKAAAMTKADYQQWLSDNDTTNKENKADVQVIEKYSEGVKKSYDTEKKKEKTAKKVTTEYEKQREILEDIRKQQDEANKIADAKLKAERLLSGFIDTETSKLEDNYALNLRKKANLDAQLQQYLAIEKQITTIKDKEEQAKARKQTTEDIEGIKNSIGIVTTEMTTFEKEIANISDKFRKEIVNIQREAAKSQLEFQVKLGLANESELIQSIISNLQAENEDLSKEIGKIQEQYNKTKDIELEKNIAELKAKIDKNNNDIATQERENIYKLEEERIKATTSGGALERELRLLELKKKYEQEKREARLNASALLAINVKYQDERIKIEQEALLATVKGYKELQGFANTLANIKFRNRDDSEVKRLMQSAKDLRKREEDLRNSYSDGKQSFEDYQKSLTDIQKEQSQNRIEIERAEAESRKAVWAEALTSISAYFSDMQKEYLDKVSGTILEKQALDKAKIQSEKEIAEKEKEIEQATADGKTQIVTQLNAQLEALLNAKMKNEERATDITKQMYTDVAVVAGAAFVSMVLDGENAIKAFLKASLAGAKAMIPVMTIAILGEEFVKSGPIGAIAAAGMSAALYGALSLAEAAVAGAFKDGVARFNGKGTGTSDSNLVRISHGESVITAKASSDNLNYEFIKFANKTGGNVIDFFKVNKDLQASVATQVYYADLKNAEAQRQLLQQLVEEKTAETANYKGELQAIKKELSEVKELLRTTKLVESKENYNVRVENKIVTAVNQLDYSVM